jgi:hypothetical protein
MMLWLAAAPAWASERTSGDALRLVRQLGASEYSLRQSAADQLLELGPAALEALQRAVQDPDPEIRLRAAHVLQRVREQHYERLLDRLLADPTNPEAARLPAWQEFRSIAGDSPAARSLYAAMLRADPELLGRIAAQGEDLPLLLRSRMALAEASIRITNHSLELELRPEEVAVLLLASLCDDLGAVGELPEYLLRSPPLPSYDQMAQAEWEPLRKLLGAWVLSPAAGSKRLRFDVAMRYRLPEVIEPAREIAADPNISVRERQDALIMIARYGGFEHIPDLEPLLEETAEVHRRSERSEVTFRTRLQDVALAVLLHLTAQNPEEYGMKAGVSRGEAFEFQAQNIGFATEEARREAIRKWRVWRAVKLQSPLFGPLDAITGTTL